MRAATSHCGHSRGAHTHAHTHRHAPFLPPIAATAEGYPGAKGAYTVLSTCIYKHVHIHIARQ